MGAKITKKLTKKIDKLTYQWTINIDSEIIEEEIKNQLKKIQSRVHIDGFRQGNAPLDMVDKKYGEDALYRAINELIRNSINEIVKDEKYKLAMQPEVSIKDDIKRNKDISVEVKITKKPEIPDIKYEKIEIDTFELELSDKNKEDEIERFRARMAKQKLAEDGKMVENGDTVDIDFVGKTASDSVEINGGSAKGYKLEIGSRSFIEGFEEQIIGHKKGETFDIKVKFPTEYHSEDLKGKDAIFTITINDIFVKELPDIDDEFAKNLGFKDIDEIKKLLFGNMKNIYEANMKNILKDRVFTLIFEKNKFDLPESIIERETDERLQKIKEANKNNKKFDEKDTKKKIQQDLHKSYAGFYLINDIAEKNAIDVSDEEIKQVATQDAIRNGMDVKDVLNRIEKDEKTKNYIYFTVKEAKVFDFIFEKIKKNVKKLDKEAFDEYMESEKKKISNSK